MTAYSALLSLAQLIHDELLPRDQHDYASLCSKEQMISLHQNIIYLQIFLEFVPDRYASMTSQLESRLTDVVYRLEDLIQSNVKGSPCPKYMLPSYVKLSPPMFYHCIEDISSIFQETKEMEEIFKQNMKGAYDVDIDLTSITHDKPGSESDHGKVGIDEDLELIIDRVTSRDKSLQIIPIVGMGGIGKTTLARAVYEDPDVLSHFDVCFWVTISQEYKVQEILRGLLEGQKPTIYQNAESSSLQEAPTDGQTKINAESSIKNKKKKEKSKVEPLDVQVYKYLFNRRFLIVMDDMWHPEAWEGVMSAIPKDQKGSRVILTTRSSAVAAKVDSSSHQHQMRLMNKETAWDLLRENVYICESCLPEFEAVGRSIAGKCDGLPLTIVVVGGLLKSNMTEEYWKQVERNINEAAAGDGRLDAVLSLSYNNLPAHLKACFLYMGVFPEDFRIPASKLFWLWIAEGFIKPQTSITLEEIAEEYLEDLVKRNLVLVATKRCNGKIRSCSIHDVPRELSLRIAEQDKFLQRFVGEYIDDVTFRIMTTSQRHVSVSTKKFGSSSLNDTYGNTFVRSLIFISCPVYLELARFRLLKVLYGVRVTGESALRRIFTLTNLRLLQFSCHHDLGRDLMVPESISKLHKLETLVVTKGSRLSIPVDIWNIPKLRHIVLPKRDCTLIFPSKAIPVLDNLQTLSWNGRGKFINNMMRRMPNLKKLKKITGQNLGVRCQLQNLAVYYCEPYFSFPHSITKLSLRLTGISSLEHVGSLPNLQVLKLSGHMNFDNHMIAWEPKEGEFLQLKYLEMNDLNIRFWRAESAPFPCLEKLVLRNLYYLEKIPLNMGNIGTLQKLIVNGCWSNVNESAERIQEEAESSGNDALQLVITNRKS